MKLITEKLRFTLAVYRDSDRQVSSTDITDIPMITKLSVSHFAILFSSLLTLSACSTTQNNDDGWQNLLSPAEQKNWTAKINHHPSGQNFANTFRFSEDMLLVRYDGYDDFNEQFGHLFYEAELTNFHLKFEYRFTGDFLESAPGYARLNSGVMFASQSADSILVNQNWPVSVEMQLLAEREAGVARPTGNMCSPGTEIYYQGGIYPEHCLNSSSPTFPAGEWVRGELIVKDGHVTQLINDDVVLEYDLALAKKDDLVTGENPATWEQMKNLKSGYIAFQSEGQPIDFKNIYLKIL